MTLDQLTPTQYSGLASIIDGQTPTNVLELERMGLVEPITQTKIEDGFRYRLSSEGRRHYTHYREHAGTQTSHLE